MNVKKQNVVLSEDEYLKKILSPLYDSKAPRDTIVNEGQKQVEELLDAEKRIQEQLINILKKYENQ